MSFFRRLAAARLVQPLRERDFALLTGGSAVSLIGDGFFHVALAWQVYGALAGAVLTILLLFVPGVRDPERVAPDSHGLVRPVPGNPEQDAL